MENLLTQWKKTYKVRKKKENIYELSLWYSDVNEIRDFYFASHDLIYKSNWHFQVKKVKTIEFLLQVALKEETFEVQRILAFDPKKGRRSRFYDQSHVDPEKWIAKQQLLNDASVPIDYRYFNWEVMYQTLEQFPFPENLHERKRVDGWLLKHPLVQINDGHHEGVKIIEYKHPSENFGHSLFLFRDGRWRIDYETTMYSSLEEAWEAFEAMLKRERLALLYL